MYDFITAQPSISNWQTNAASGFSYKVITDPQSWTESHKICTKEGAELLSIQDTEELAFLHGVLLCLATYSVFVLF